MDSVKKLDSFFELALPDNETIVGDYSFTILNWGKVIPGKWRNNSHKHCYYEATYVYAGDALCEMEDTVIEANKGQWLLFCPGERHQIYSNHEELGVYCMFFSLFTLQNINTKTTSVGCNLADALLKKSKCLFDGSKHTLTLCELMTDEVSEQKKGFNELFSGLASMLVFDLLRCLDANVKDDVAPFASFGNTEEIKLQKAVKFIEANLESDLSVKDIASYLHISERQLTRIFKKVLFLPPSQVITRIKLNAAMKMLSSTDLLIKEVAQKCGFNCERYFMNTFKKHVGLTAKTFRAKSRKSRDFAFGFFPVLSSSQ